MSKNNHLDDLRNRKKLIKAEIAEIEDILTFKSKKDSLSVLTNGVTDQFLKETHNEEGVAELSLDTKNIMRLISENIKESTSKNNMMRLADESLESGLLENTLKIGAVSIVGNYAKKNMMNSNWKKKALGLALIYVAPYVLKFLRKKLDNYQKNKTTSSLEKLI